MASSEMRGDGSEVATDTGVATDSEAKAAEVVQHKEERSPRRFPSSRVLGAAERDKLLREARAVEFPVGLRGYERGAVDRYVERVSRIIAELEISSSPESAVRHALDEVSEETRDILQHAHQTAEEITARSRAKADDRLEQAEREAQEILDAAQQETKDTREAAHREAQETRETAQREAQELREITTGEAQNLRENAQHEAAELRETTLRELTELRETAARETQQLQAAAQREADEVLGSARREATEALERAETRARELARNAEAIWRERRRLIDDMRAVGDQLVAIGEVEGKRFPAFAEELLPGDEHAHEQASAPGSDPAAVPEHAMKT
jgi:DivIVA domain-containing protein